MIILNNSYPTAEENLAFEAAYFQKFKQDTLRIWRNPNAVIIGKHQNAFSESNIAYCIKNKIPIIRRISGGGTVFHDLGNINFSFYRFVDQTNQIKYSDNLKIITDSLSALGFSIWVNDRHDIYAGDSKISGNAQHVSKGRALHHGTILYDSDMTSLRSAIKKKHGIFTDKSVKSFRSKVTNLRNFKELGSCDDFEKLLLNQLRNEGQLTEPQIDLMPEISNYHSEDWNFGYGPGFKFTSNDITLPFELEVNRAGEILMATSTNIEIQNLLKGFPPFFRYSAIKAYLDKTNTDSSRKLFDCLFA